MRCRYIIYYTIVVLFSLVTLIIPTHLKAKVETPCDNPCLTCQLTAYNLKFHQKSNCKTTHCRNTCQKVHEDWGTPGTIFQSFISDTVSKCDVCFRAGYCSINECEVQKNFEKSVINQSVDEGAISGIADNKELSQMVNKIMHDKPVDFKAIRQKVQHNINEVAKKIGKKSMIKLTATVQAVMNNKSSRTLKQDLKHAEEESNEYEKKHKNLNLGMNIKIRTLIDSFENVVNSVIDDKGKKKEH